MLHGMSWYRRDDNLLIFFQEVAILMPKDISQFCFLRKFSAQTLCEKFREVKRTRLYMRQSANFLLCKFGKYALLKLVWTHAVTFPLKNYFFHFQGFNLLPFSMWEMRFLLVAFSLLPLIESIKNILLSEKFPHT